MDQARPRTSRWPAALLTATMVTGFAAVMSPAAADTDGADAAEQILFEEDFSRSELSDDWNPVEGDWDIADGRLQSTTGTDAARIGFGPEVAPENFRLEVTAEFVEAENPARWLSVGLDYHAEDHWGSWIGLRSATSADNGVELVQRPRTGGNTLTAYPGPFDMGTGEAHDLVFEVRGNSLEFSMDGETVMSTDALIRTGGGFGFRYSRATVAFDDIRITQLLQEPTAPSEPIDLRLTESGDSANLTWNEPENLGTDATGEAASITGYEVAIAAAGVPDSDVEWASASGNSHVFTDLPDESAQVLRVRAVNNLDLTGPASSVVTMRGAETSDGFKLRLENGPWPTSHVQGIAVDPVNEFIYYSFTTLLVKTDFAGNLIGTVGGFTGHLGDLDFNPEDGRVYGSLEYKAEEVFYIAIFDVDQIDRVGIDGQNSDVVSTVYLDEATQDYIADMDGDGVFDGNVADTADHRYGASGIDGVAFGPEFGSVDGTNYLTVAYGIYENNDRVDNDHQVLLQYDVSNWGEFELPLSEGKPHRVGPDDVDGKYFAFTGNTRYGVQNLEYDPWLERWFMAVYPGSKDEYPNYLLFAVDAVDAPTFEALEGLGGEKGMLLPLADDGLEDPATGIRGWQKDGSVGFQSLENGLFYVSEATTQGGAGAILHLECWTGDADEPFQRVEDGCSFGPEFTSGDPVDGEVGEPYEHQLATRSFPSVVFRVDEGTLPSGLEMDEESGLISGIPTEEIATTVTVVASNGTQEARSELAFTIRAKLTEPDPTEPEPTDPEPTEPGPTNPEDSDLDPTGPGDSDHSELPATGADMSSLLAALLLIVSGAAAVVFVRFRKRI